MNIKYQGRQIKWAYLRGTVTGIRVMYLESINSWF